MHRLAVAGPEGKRFAPGAWGAGHAGMRQPVYWGGRDTRNGGREMRDRVLAVAAVVVLAATGCITVQVGFGAMGASGLREVVVERSPRWMERSRVAIVDVDGFIGA